MLWFGGVILVLYVIGSINEAKNGEVTMWRLYLKLGLKEDFIEFEDMRECMRLADRMKKAYPWYTVKVRRVNVCG